MSKLKILAIDPAEITGWATSDGKWGLWKFKLKRDETNGFRLLRFRKEFMDKVNEFEPDVIVYERVSGRFAVAIMSHAKYVGVMEEYCIENGDIPLKGYSAKEIKKYATGNGNASKNDMVKAAIRRYKYRGSDDNEADAICLLELAKSELHA